MYERIQKAVKKFYLKAKNSDDFIPVFEELIIQYIQDLKLRKRLDEKKLEQEIEAIAEKTKRENQTTSFFLMKIAELLVYVIEGKHDFFLDPDQTKLFDFNPLDLKDDPRNRKNI